jgi:transketolase
LTGRALEQIKADIAYSNMPVVLCGISSGMAYGPLGPTHHSIEDFAWTRVLKNLMVVAPADPVETAQAVRAAAAHDGPVFLRLSRMGVPIVHSDSYRFEFGKAAMLLDGDDLTIVANGVTVASAMLAAAALARDGIAAEVLNVATVKPLDEAAIVASAKKTGAVLTVEEHHRAGGLGSAVAECLVEQHPVPMKLLGMPGFAPIGSAEYLLAAHGLDAKGIEAAARTLMTRKSNV